MSLPIRQSLSGSRRVGKTSSDRAGKLSAVAEQTGVLDQLH